MISGPHHIQLFKVVPSNFSTYYRKDSGLVLIFSPAVGEESIAICWGHGFAGPVNSKEFVSRDGIFLRSGIFWIRRFDS